MNGRVYDPALGRFLSADPYVKYPEGAQGLNRYSYVDNNPLSRVDPSGFGWLSKTWKKVKKWVKPIVAAIAAYYTFGWSAIMTGSYISAGINAGFVGGLIASGGNLKAAMGAAATGAIFGGIRALNLTGWTSIGMNGAVGGVSSKLQGGDFRSGFWSTGLPAFVDIKLGTFRDVYQQVAFKSIVGGTASKLSGGKFENGAITSAFMTLFVGSQGHSKYSKSFATEEELAGYMGPNSMISGQRPLDVAIFRNIVFEASEGGWLAGWNKDVAHQQIFFTDEAGRLHNAGYNPSGPVPEGKPYNDMPFSSFKFDSQVYDVTPELLLKSALPGFDLSGDNYRLTGQNCQAWGACARAHTLAK